MMPRRCHEAQIQSRKRAKRLAERRAMHVAQLADASAMVSRLRQLQGPVAPLVVSPFCEPATDQEVLQWVGKLAGRCDPGFYGWEASNQPTGVQRSTVQEEDPTDVNFHAARTCCR